MILVTGASGLLGQHLVAALSQTEKLRAICRVIPTQFFVPIQSKNVEWISCDILDISGLEKAFENITHVYHCAAMVSYDPQFKEDMMEVNIEGTSNIVNLCLDFSVRKLIHVSSIATLGEGQEGQFITEKDEWEELSSNSNYSKSKQGAEMEAWRGEAEGLEVAIVNPGIILGEGDLSKSSSNLFNIAQKEFPYYTKGITAWVDVQDVVKAMILLMNSSIHNQRFIVSAGNYSFQEVFTMMTNAMHKKPPYKFASPFMTELLWRIAYLKSKLSGKQATISKETARSAQTIRRFDNTKLLKALDGFTYQEIDKTILRVVSS